MLNCNAYTPYTAHTSSLTTIIPHLLIYIDDRHINHARAPQCCNPDPRCRPETYCPGPGLQVDGSLLRTTAVSTCCSVPTPPNLQSSNPLARNSATPEARRKPAGANITTHSRQQRCERRFHHNIGTRRFVSQGRVTAGRLGESEAGGALCLPMRSELTPGRPRVVRLKERSEGRGSLG
jgi:hypothetical protein